MNFIVLVVRKCGEESDNSRQNCNRCRSLQINRMPGEMEIKTPKRFLEKNVMGIFHDYIWHQCALDNKSLYSVNKTNALLFSLLSHRYCQGHASVSFASE